MSSSAGFFRWTELDRTSFPELRDRILRADAESGRDQRCRSYPSYPTWRLERPRPRRWTALDGVLANRRCQHRLGVNLPERRALSRLLFFAHGVQASGQRGPVPSAGGLQAVELYLVNCAASWLPAGVYHYARAAHLLAQLVPNANRLAWLERVPSLQLVEGGALLWIVVGDGARVTAKYGARGLRFLLLEAGHLMQNLCMLAASLGLITVPLGGFFESEIAAELQLPAADEVLYVGVCGGGVGGP